jgi:hypothetical protein
VVVVVDAGSAYEFGTTYPPDVVEYVVVLVSGVT